MAVAPLLAPGGVEMRVVSQAAAFTWGSWSVSWPEGYEPPDPPAEDRELGWVADLGGQEVEPFGRCFVRADAQIDATLGRSNVEDVLDAARYRTSGEVFLETEIPFENLAGQLPYRDFDVNSFVPVRLGGRILEGQLVTKVEESEDELGNRTAVTYIGGQKFQDREALRTRNREIDRVIAQERLERGDEIGAKLAASQEYEREQRDELKRYVDRRDMEDLRDAKSDSTLKANAAEGRAKTHADTAASTAEENAKTHAEEEDKKLKRDVNLIIGPEGSLTRQVKELNDDYTAKLGENGSVIADQAAHQRMLSGIVYGTPVSELEGTAFKEQQQAVNEMNDVFRNRQTTINGGFKYLFGLNEKINLAQDYTIAYHRILAESHAPKGIYMSAYFPHGFTEKPREFYFMGAAKDLFFERISVSRVDEGHAEVTLETVGREHLLGGLFLMASAKSRAVEGGSWTMVDQFPSGMSEYAFTFPLDINGQLTVGGVVMPFGLTLPFIRQIDALNAEYRDKGLRI